MKYMKRENQENAMINYKIKICVTSFETNQNYTEVSVWNGNYIITLEKKNEVAILQTSATEPPSPRSIQCAVSFGL